MAKITSSASEQSGRKFSPRGTMPKDMLKRFKLSGNIADPRDVVYSHHDRKISRSIRAIHSYRQFVHGCNEARVPSCLRRSAHYFAIPMSQYQGGSAEEKTGSVPVVSAVS
jgi:hypothetical protein